MRHFFSYGPVDCEEHFCVSRDHLIQQCTSQLIDKPDKGGHYFTIWAPRQTGKTWLMRQVTQRIRADYGDRFQIGNLSMQGIILEDDDPVDRFLSKVPYIMRDGFGMSDFPIPNDWENFPQIFARHGGIFEKPSRHKLGGRGTASGWRPWGTGF